jgi:hypothetical protein
MLLLCANAYGADEAARIYPTDLKYNGAFRVPRDRTLIDGDSVFYGYGNYYVSLGWDYVNKHILLPARNKTYHYVGSFAPKKPKITKSISELETAELSLRFTDFASGYQEGYNKVSSAIRFKNKDYYWVMHNSYDVTRGHEPRLGYYNPDINNRNRWSLIDNQFRTNIESRNWSRWITDIDSDWADKHFKEGAVAVGNSRTNGSFGPSIYFIKKTELNNSKQLAAATVGIEYDDNHIAETFSFSAAYSGGAWLHYKDKEGKVKRAYVALVRDGFRVDLQYNGTKWWHTNGTGKSIGYKNRDSIQIVLAENISNNAERIPLKDASNLPDTGYIIVQSELIKYKGKNGHTLTGCERGATYKATNTPTTAASHSANSTGFQAMSDVVLYGTNVDGFDSVILIPMLQFYDVNEISEVIKGDRAAYDIQPYAYMTLDHEFYQSMAARGGPSNPIDSPRIAAGAFDLGITTDGNGNIFIGEKDGENERYDRWPIIHQYSFNGQEGRSINWSSTEKPPTPKNINIDKGTVSWDQIDKDVMYVIFKWFNNPHHSVAGEYRPIRTTLTNTWYDYHYTAGDHYMIIAYTRAMIASDSLKSDPTKSDFTYTSHEPGGTIPSIPSNFKGTH